MKKLWLLLLLIPLIACLGQTLGTFTDASFLASSTTSPPPPPETLYYVSPDGSVTNTGLSTNSPWPMYYALTNVSASNTIIVMPGGYSGDQTFNTPGLTIRAQTKWCCWFTNATAGGGIALYPAPAYGITLDGLIISNAAGPGILAAYGSNNTFRHLKISHTGQDGAGTGDGIYAKGVNGTKVEFCLIELNGQLQGQHHGIYVGGNDCVVRCNVIRSNWGFGCQFNVASGFPDRCYYYNNLSYSNGAGGGTVYELAFSSDSGGGGGTNHALNNTFRSRSSTFAYVSRNTTEFTNNIINTSGDVATGTAGVARLGSNLSNSSNTNFINAPNGLWWLSTSSAARGIANQNSIPPIDFFGTNQSSVVDVGAFQYSTLLAVDSRDLDVTPAEGANYWLPGTELFSPWTLGATTWYEPHLGYATNNGWAILSNLTTHAALFDLTNTAGLKSPARQVAVQNGLDGLFFNSAATNWLDCTNYQTLTPHEAIIAVAITNNNAVRFLFSSMTNLTTHRFGVALSGGAKFTVATDGNGGNSSITLTNKYFVLNAMFTSTNCRVFTNLVGGVLVGGNVTATNCSGLRIGKLAQGDTAGGNEAPALASLLALITFTNQYLTTEIRSNCFRYLTNRFAITL